MFKTFTVIGLGRFGSEIAARLYDAGADVLVIDTDETTVNAIADKVSRAVVADSRDCEVLRRLGVDQSDCAIVAIGSDFSASVLTAMNLKTIGVPYVICKAQNDTHKAILEKIGADQVMIPEREFAAKTARSLTSTDMFEQISLSDEYGIYECKAPASWVGKTLRELNIRMLYHVNVIAIREKDEIKISPSPDYHIENGSSLLVLGDNDSLSDFKNVK